MDTKLFLQCKNTIFSVYSEKNADVLDLQLEFGRVYVSHNRVSHDSSCHPTPKITNTNCHKSPTNLTLILRLPRCDSPTPYTVELSYRGSRLSLFSRIANADIRSGRITNLAKQRFIENGQVGIHYYSPHHLAHSIPYPTLCNA